MNRALRAATMGALLVSPLALGACSAGQVTQTATQERDKVGGTADVGNVLVRALELDYPTGGAYAKGDDVELTGAIVNSADGADTLVSITGDGFEGVRVIGGSGSGASGASSGSAFGDEVGIEIPSAGTVFLGGSDAPSILLENLTDGLTTGQGVALTMTFELAGDVDVIALVGNPDRAIDRGEAFDFHDENAELGDSGLPGSGAEVGGPGGTAGGDGPEG